MSDDDLKNFKISDQVRQRVDRPGAPAKGGDAPAAASVGFPRIEGLLEGGELQAGDNVRINVQLISAETDEHLWARTYDRALSMSNIFAIQSEIAESITRQLAATLSPDELDRIRRNPTDNLQAYYPFARGRQLRAKATFDALRQAEQAFRLALELDPRYVDAQIDLARRRLEGK